MNEIYNMDCVEGMKLIRDDFVDLVVTSPPYDNLRLYNGFSFDFESTAKELYRIVKQGGVVVWVVADQTLKGSESGTSFRQALYFKKIGFNLHDTMIYAKYNPVPLTHNRYEQQFEYMFVFSKGRPKTFNPIKEKTKTYGSKCDHSQEKQYEASYAMKRTDKLAYVRDEKIINNIWFYAVGSGDKVTHNAPFPEKLVEDHLKSWSNGGDIVLDPFMGSGTTAKVCLQMQRKYIGFEIGKEYCEEAEKRIDYYKRQITIFDIIDG